MSLEIFCKKLCYTYDLCLVIINICYNILRINFNYMTSQ